MNVSCDFRAKFLYGASLERVMMTMKDFANVDADSDDDGDDDDNDYDDFDVDGGAIDENCAERPKPPRFLRLCFYFPHKISDS